MCLFSNAVSCKVMPSKYHKFKQYMESEKTKTKSGLLTDDDKIGRWKNSSKVVKGWT